MLSQYKIHGSHLDQQDATLTVRCIGKGRTRGGMAIKKEIALGCPQRVGFLAMSLHCVG